MKLCVSCGAVDPGKQLHARILLNGLAADPALAPTLVNLYCVSGRPADARAVFDRIPGGGRGGSNFLWNLLIRAYTRHEQYQDALSLFRLMLDRAVVPDAFTFPHALKACAGLSAPDVGRDVHACARRLGLDRDRFVASALIDMYARCGQLAESRALFFRIPDRDTVVWNSLLSACARCGDPYEALLLGREMAGGGGRSPSPATFVILIAAAADAAALSLGRELHGSAGRRGLASGGRVGPALVDMYAKCGSLDSARAVFGLLEERRLVSWNAMISGYSMHGRAGEALALFEEMVAAGGSPDPATLVGVLSACSHGGLLAEGRRLFHTMEAEYGIPPRVEHYTCMVSLLGNCGRVEEAYAVIEGMGVPPDSAVWGALLGSCRRHGNMPLAELAAGKAAGDFVTLSNIYARAGRWDRAEAVRRAVAERGVRKEVGCSWIEVNGAVHGFVTGDGSHPMVRRIYAELGRIGALMAEAGYLPDTTTVLHDVGDDEKAEMVSRHSERLAIAFGAVATPPGRKLVVIKNLRVCEDCHVAVKLMSSVLGREIILRDVNRFHRFRDGVCSCDDRW